ncbi:MAG: peptidase S8 [Chloroflexi bacterium]|nr:MAG: peptidase S8 [Chloroflexota bacterium]RLC77114.1 MAG: peptidase S8 [Chloroflexota bacterium]
MTSLIFTKEAFRDQVGHFNWSQISLTHAKEEAKLEGGRGVKVAVVDSGIDIYHEDLADTVRGGVNFTTEHQSDYIDRFGHGTFCAGIIAASDNGIGVTGIAPNVELYAVKVINDMGLGTPDWATRGIEWCIDHKMDIVSLSLEDQMPYKPLELAVRRAIASGTILAASAGNLGDGDPTTIELAYPAAYPEVISVAAHDKMLQHADFASTNPEVDVSAPGINIVSCFPGDMYSVQSGTSMAVPYIVGIIALLKSQNPDLLLEDIEHIIQQTSVDKGVPGRDPAYGWGILSLESIAALLDSI